MYILINHALVSATIHKRPLNHHYALALNGRAVRASTQRDLRSNIWLNADSTFL
jgi:hypothetical protein